MHVAARRFVDAELPGRLDVHRGQQQQAEARRRHERPQPEFVDGRQADSGGGRHALDEARDDAHRPTRERHFVSLAQRLLGRGDAVRGLSHSTKRALDTVGDEELEAAGVEAKRDAPRTWKDDVDAALVAQPELPRSTVVAES